MIFFIDIDREKRNTAGAKAPDDIAYLCLQRGYTRFEMPNFPVEKNKIEKKIWLLTKYVKWWRKLEAALNKGDVVIYQHPTYGKRVASKMIRRIQKKRKCKFIAVVHDLESLRGGIQGVISSNKKTEYYGDTKLLNAFDAVICHNDSMKKYMVEVIGLDEKKLVCLNIFDYLSDYTRPIQNKLSNPTIAIAGNLALGKCAYIYDICTEKYNKNLLVNLYGNNFESSKARDERLKWNGSFAPADLPSHLECDFGLVWDGNSADTCTGNTGNYLRYNNPHKTSLYLSAGIPVIVWKKAAIAEFVINNKVGIAVENLHELDALIGNMKDSEYRDMCENVLHIAEKLRNGKYFYEALDYCLADIVRYYE